MTLVKFGINEENSSVPNFCKPFIQQLIMYQIEMVPVHIIDLDKKMQSYTHLQVTKPYKALNSETYISLRNQALRMCRNIGYEFYCKDFFGKTHKSKYSCKSAIYFNLGLHIQRKLQLGLLLQ